MAEGGLFTIRVSGHTVTLVRDGIPESTVLPEFVPRRMLLRLANKYSIPTEYFFHPAMLPQSGQGSSAH
jgi:hypothetical protein